MTIVEARALPYNEMMNFVLGKPINCFGNKPIGEFEKIYIISITDPETPAIFKQDSDEVLCLKFKDIDPQNVSFEPPNDNVDYMTKTQAKQLVDFLKRIHFEDTKKVLLLVNCHQGWCRSGAVVDFAGTVFGLGFYNMRDCNPQMLPNHWVRYLLFQEWFKQLS